MSGSFFYQGKNGNNKKNNGNQKNWANFIGNGNLENITIQDLFGGKQLEYVAAALLLTGKLRVDAVQLYRSSSVISVTLVGNYISKNRTNPLEEFLEQNGDITINEIFEAFRNKLEKG